MLPTGVRAAWHGPVDCRSRRSSGYGAPSACSRIGWRPSSSQPTPILSPRFAMSSASMSRYRSVPSFCASTISRRSRRWIAANRCSPCGIVKFILAQSGRTFLCAHHRAQDQVRHLSQRRGAMCRDHVIHRTPQCRTKTVPMDQISRRHSQLDPTILRLQLACQGLKCHLVVQDTSASVCP